MMCLIHICLVSSIYWVNDLFVTLALFRFTLIPNDCRCAEDVFKTLQLVCKIVSRDVCDGRTTLFSVLFVLLIAFLFLWLHFSYLSIFSNNIIYSVPKLTLIIIVKSIIKICNKRNLWAEIFYEKCFFFS